MTQPGDFDLFTKTEKAEVCQTAMHTWDELKNKAVAIGGTAPDVCALLTSHIFQSYSFHLQDLSEAIVGALTTQLSEKLAAATNDYDKQKNETNVKQFLKEQKGTNIQNEGQKLIDDINKATFDKQMNKVATQALQEANDLKKEAQDVAAVQNSIADLRSIGDYRQMTPDQAKASIKYEKKLDDVQAFVTDLNPDSVLDSITDSQQVNKFLEGVQTTEAAATVDPQTAVPVSSPVSAAQVLTQTSKESMPAAAQ